MASIYASTHNEAMTYIFNRMESYPTENVESVVFSIYGDFCTERGIPLPTLFPPMLPTFPEDFNDLDLHGIVDGSELSEGLKEKGKALVDIVLQTLPFNPFAEAIQRLLDESRGALNEAEYQVLDDAAEVARQSHQLYIGDGEEITDFVAKSAQTGGGSQEDARSINWWKVGGCDVVGGLVSGGTAALGASAISVIMQW